MTPQKKKEWREMVGRMVASGAATAPEEAQKTYRGVPIEQWRANNRRHAAAWRLRNPKPKPRSKRPRYFRRFSKESGYTNHPSLKGLIDQDYHREHMRLWRARRRREGLPV